MPASEKEKTLWQEINTRDIAISEAAMDVYEASKTIMSQAREIAQLKKENAGLRADMCEITVKYANLARWQLLQEDIKL